MNLLVEVAAFVTPLLIGFGLIGTFVGWGIKRNAEKIRTEITTASTQLSARLDATIELFKERFRSVDEQLASHTRTLEAQNTQMLNTGLTVAKIEGTLEAAAKTPKLQA